MAGAARHAAAESGRDVPSLLVIDEPRERVEEWRAALESAGYRIVVSPPDETASVRMPATVARRDRVAGPRVGVARRGTCSKHCGRPAPHMSEVPVVAVVDQGALEDGLRAAIEGAVRCLAEPVEAGVLAATLDAVLAPDAPPQPEQRRLSRQRALAVLARIEAAARPPTTTCTRGSCTSPAWSTVRCVRPSPSRWPTPAGASRRSPPSSGGCSISSRPKAG